jgi:hypothetical protein
MTPQQNFTLVILFICVAASALMSVVFIVLFFGGIIELWRDTTTQLRKAQIMALLLSYALFPVIVVISYFWFAESLGRASSDGSGLGVDHFLSPLRMILGVQIAAFALLFYLRLRDGGLLPVIRVTFAGIIPVIYLSLLCKL